MSGLSVGGPAQGTAGGLPSLDAVGMPTLQTLNWAQRGGTEQHPATVQTQPQALGNTSSFAGINAQSPALQEGRFLIWDV